MRHFEKKLKEDCYVWIECGCPVVEWAGYIYIGDPQDAVFLREEEPLPEMTPFYFARTIR
jgi:hypothetical protein